MAVSSQSGAAASRRLHDRIFDAHAIMTRPDGATLLHVDRHIVHDASAQAFDMLDARGLSVRRPVHDIEFAGSTVEALSVEARMTLCNMSIEAGARIGMVAPDDQTFQWLAGRTWAPAGRMWDEAVAFWRGLATDPDAGFDREVAIDAAAIAPTVTWGTSPEDALPSDACVPDPADCPDPDRRRAIAGKLAYMGLRPGTPLAGIAVQRVFIGSCTNSRIEDLRAEASIARHHRAQVPTQVSPGSAQVKAQAESEGLHHVFHAAGFEWTDPGCSMCVAINGDSVPQGLRCASTSNRNFAGRQGRGSRTHLLSPEMAAAAAVTGQLIDVRKLMGSGTGNAA